MIPTDKPTAPHNGIVHLMTLVTHHKILLPNLSRGLGLSDWGEDVAVAMYAAGPLKYPMTQELTTKSLGAFVMVRLLISGCGLILLATPPGLSGQKAGASLQL